MDQIIVDESFARQLGAAPSIVLDATGKRLGCFIPEADPTIYKTIRQSVSDDELTRRENAGGGRQLPEILDDLRKRAQ
jgi:hypothetical protein